jgi:dephospho-CoA kinase
VIIGVVGKSGSGKNYVVKENFYETGFIHFDLDVYGHEVFEEKLEKIGETFYGNNYTNTSFLSREDVAKIVFKNKDALLTLENIVHPLITERVLKDLKGSVFLNGAVLHKSKLLEKCDHVIYVKAPLWKRVWRLYKRDNKSIIHILRRIYSQRDISPKLYKKCLIVNN